MTTKLYQCIASGRNQVRLRYLPANSKEYALGWAHSDFQKAEGFNPSSVEAVEIEGDSIRKAMPAALSEKIGIGFRSVGVTVIDDTIVFHATYKSDNPASIAHQMAEIKDQCSEDEFVAAFKVVMSGCAFLKDITTNKP